MFYHRSKVDTLKNISIAWVVLLILICFIVKPITETLFKRLTEDKGRFNARILLNSILNVTMTSLFMTIIGLWIEK